MNAVILYLFRLLNQLASTIAAASDGTMSHDELYEQWFTAMAADEARMLPPDSSPDSE